MGAHRWERDETNRGIAMGTDVDPRDNIGRRRLTGRLTQDPITDVESRIVPTPPIRAGPIKYPRDVPPVEGSTGFHRKPKKELKTLPPEPTGATGPQRSVLGAIPRDWPDTHEKQVEGEGHWVTLEGGQRVFIREGESIQDAFKRQKEDMKRPGVEMKPSRLGITKLQNDGKDIRRRLLDIYDRRQDAQQVGGKEWERVRTETDKELRQIEDKEVPRFNESLKQAYDKSDTFYRGMAFKGEVIDKIDQTGTVSGDDDKVVYMTLSRSMARDFSDHVGYPGLVMEVDKAKVKDSWPVTYGGQKDEYGRTYLAAYTHEVEIRAKPFSIDAIKRTVFFPRKGSEDADRRLFDELKKGYPKWKWSWRGE